MGVFRCLLHRIVAAWRIMMADEFIFITKKHCLTHMDKCAGVELVDDMYEYLQNGKEK